LGVDTDVANRKCHVHNSKGCVLFADIADFMKTTELVSSVGYKGTSWLAQKLNVCFSKLITIIHAYGGDVFKFCGDGLIVFWPANCDENEVISTATAMQNAVKCALEMQKIDTSPFVFKIGIGEGLFKVLHVGAEIVSEGNNNLSRRDYIALGDAINKAFEAEKLANAKQIIVSKDGASIAQLDCNTELIPTIDNKFVQIKAVNMSVQNNHHADSDNNSIDFHVCEIASPRMAEALQSFVPVQARREKKRDMDSLLLHNKSLLRNQTVNNSRYYKDWISELRQITCTFVSLGFQNELSVEKLDECFGVVQKTVVAQGGVVNKLCFDEKGISVLAAFGLPMTLQENAASRAMFACLQMINDVKSKKESDTSISIGVTTGVAYCGIIGDINSRKEYTILGDCVNVASRLMQVAKYKVNIFQILADKNTFELARKDVLFGIENEVKIKGKSEPVLVYAPADVDKLKKTMRYSFLKSCEYDEHEETKSNNGDGKSIDRQDTQWCWEMQLARYVYSRKEKIIHGKKKGEIPWRVAGKSIQDTPEGTAVKIRKMLENKCKQFVLIQGEKGGGKTHLVQHVYKEICDNTAIGSMAVLAIGNPFEIVNSNVHKPFRIMVDLINQVLETYHDRTNETCVHIGVEGITCRCNNTINIEVMLHKLLQRSKSSLGTHAWVLNELFDVNFRIPHGKNLVNSDSNNLMQRARLALLADLFVGINDLVSFQITCIIDDASYMDYLSWMVLLSLQGLENVSIVLSTRNLLHPLFLEKSTIDERVLEAFTDLKEMSSSWIYELKPLNRDEVSMISRSYLKVLNVGEDLVDFLDISCNGNPLFVREVLHHMVKQKVVNIDSDHKTPGLMHKKESFLLGSGKQELFNVHVDANSPKTPLKRGCRRKNGSSDSSTNGNFSMNSSQKRRLRRKSESSSSLDVSNISNKARFSRYSRFLSHISLGALNYQNPVNSCIPVSLVHLIGSYMDNKINDNMALMLKVAAVAADSGTIEKQICELAYPYKESMIFKELNIEGIIIPDQKEASYLFGSNVLKSYIASTITADQKQAIQRRLHIIRLFHMNGETGTGIRKGPVGARKSKQKKKTKLWRKTVKHVLSLS